MKRFIYTLLFLSYLFTLAPFNISAQSRSERRWEGPQLDANFGIGLLSTFAADKARTITPPLTIGGEYLINEKGELTHFFASKVKPDSPEFQAAIGL